MNSAPIYLDLDSRFRQPDDTSTFFSIPFDNQTTIIGKKSEKFLVKVTNFVISYSAFVSGLPRLYLDLHTLSFLGDKPSIFFSNPALNENRFILVQDKTFFNGVNPAWISFKTEMVQMLRFIGNTSIVVKVSDQTGVVLPDVQNQEMLMTFELKNQHDFSDE
jgi:hypothetical protein